MEFLQSCTRGVALKLLKANRRRIRGWKPCATALYLSKKRKEQLMVKTISRDELKQKIDRGDRFRLVETLPEAAFHHAHLPGAINLPPDRVKELAPTLLPDKNADIVVNCAKPS